MVVYSKVSEAPTAVVYPDHNTSEIQWRRSPVNILNKPNTVNIPDVLRDICPCGRCSRATPGSSAQYAVDIASWRRSSANILNMPNSSEPTHIWSVTRVCSVRGRVILLEVFGRASHIPGLWAYDIKKRVLVDTIDMDPDMVASLELNRFLSTYSTESGSVVGGEATPMHMKSLFCRYIARVLTAKSKNNGFLHFLGPCALRIRHFHQIEQYAVVEKFPEALVLPISGAKCIGELVSLWKSVSAAEVYTFSMAVLPPLIELAQLQYVDDLHEDTIFVVSIPNDVQLYAYKTTQISGHYRFLYHELRVLLTKEAHCYTVPGPSYLVWSHAGEGVVYPDLFKKPIIGFLTPFFPGKTLEDTIQTPKEFPPPSSRMKIKWCYQLSLALLHNQQHGYGKNRPSFYSDLKPNQVRIIEPDANVMLLDFEQCGNWDEYKSPEEKPWKHDFIYRTSQEFDRYTLTYECNCDPRNGSSISNTCASHWPYSKSNMATMGVIFGSTSSAAMTNYTNRHLFGRQPFWNETSLAGKEAALVYSLGKVLLFILDDCRKIEKYYFNGETAWRRHVDEGRCFTNVPVKLMEILHKMVKKEWSERPKLADVVLTLKTCDGIERMRCWRLPAKKHVPMPSGPLWSVPVISVESDEEEEEVVMFNGLVSSDGEGESTNE